MQYDAAIIGAGPGGYAAAIRLGQHGKKVLLAEKDKIGGECLNYGCIPSKALIELANSIHYLKEIPGAHSSFDLNMKEWQESERYITLLWFPEESICLNVLCTPSIATSGKFIIGVETIPPIVPMFVTVNVPFCTSPRLSEDDLALDARSLTLSAMPVRLNLSALCTTATVKPS